MTGPTGPAGPVGTARAYAVVETGGHVVTNGGQFDISVTKPATGVYCIVVPVAIGAINGVAVATLESPGTDTIAISSLHGSLCNDLNTATTGAFPVYTRTGANAAADRAFHIVIP